MSWYAAGSCAARAAIPGRAVGDGDGDGDGGRGVSAAAVAGAEGAGVAVLVASGALQAVKSAAESKVSVRT